MEDIRIPGLYSLIQRYKSDGKTEMFGVEGDKKTDATVKKDANKGIENGASKNAEADNASSERDMSKNSAQTANGEKNGNTSSNQDNKQERGAGGYSNLPYFFQGLNYQNLNPNDSDSHGVSRACKEIQLFSNKKLVDTFPMAAAFLTRTIIEHALIYYSKKHKIQGQNKYNFSESQ